MKCQHDPCACVVDEGDGYCSDHCRHHTGEAGSQCDCGHPACEMQG